MTRLTMPLALALLLAVLTTRDCALAMAPAEVRLTKCAAGPNAPSWALAAPNQTDPLAPHFRISATSQGDGAVRPTPADGLQFKIKGSLGLAGLGPLGIFGFNEQGPLCNTNKTVWVLDGTLGRVELSAPCSTKFSDIGAPFQVAAEVFVYTPLPVFPSIGLAASFDAELVVEDAQGKALMCAHLHLQGDPSGPGADPSKDTCNMDLLPDIPDEPPADMVIPEYTIDLDDEPENRWHDIVVPLTEGMRELVHTYVVQTRFFLPAAFPLFSFFPHKMRGVCAADDALATAPATTLSHSPTNPTSRHTGL